MAGKGGAKGSKGVNPVMQNSLSNNVLQALGSAHPLTAEEFAQPVERTIEELQNLLKGMKERDATIREEETRAESLRRMPLEAEGTVS